MGGPEFEGQVIAITGGGGTLCSPMARALAARGARIGILQRNLEKAEGLAREIEAAGGQALGIATDVLDRPSVERAAELLLSEYGRIDALINGAGGNNPKAYTSKEQPFFDLPVEALRGVVDLNLLGTLICCQVFGKVMVQQERGVILNIASMASMRPLTHSIAYSAAKAGVANFTQWLAVHMSQEYSRNIRVNAILPGFFMAEQNRFQLIDASTGELNPRAKTIVAHTPMARFGDPEDLVGTVLWLLSDASSFVHGALIPVDGGFSAFSGV